MLPLNRFALPCFAVVLLSGVLSSAQRIASKPLIVERVNDNQLVTLRGNTPPAATEQNDRGAVSPGLNMSGLILVLHRSAEQQEAFDAFVASQYDPNSPNFHHWLEPEEVGEKFGPALADIATVSSWLVSHGLSVDEVSKDRMTIRFSGSAARVQAAFHTEIHNLVVKGEPHISNMSDPQIPMALDPVVLGPKALHNFTPRPMHHAGAKVTRNSETGRWTRDAVSAGMSWDVSSARVRPEFGLTGGTAPDTYQVEDVSPYDFAAIYNVLPLWNSSIDGAGQTIAVVGTSDVNLVDVASFKTTFGLPLGHIPIITLAHGTDPGRCTSTQPPSASNNYCTLDDQIENALDVEWSGAVAPGAQVVLVVSGATSGNDDTVFDSAQYAIQHNTAKILNVSYGLCELFLGTTNNASYNGLWQTAATQGIAVFAASGDSGSPSCDQGGDASGTPYSAQYGLSVSGLASSPFDTAVGGTDLNWGSTASPYWNATNNSANGSSAKGYMPEIPWNDSCTNLAILPALQNFATQLQHSGYSAAASPTDAESACNFVVKWNSTIQLLGGPDISFVVDTAGAGGGKSNCTTSDGSTVASCTGGYAAPSWQTGVPGIPADGKRYIPDVSFFASNGFLGSAYLVCVSDWGTCITRSTTDEPSAQEIGGTSASSPAMAGVMALINQKAGSTQGNPNSVLYQLAAKQTYSSCKSANGATSNGCYFNDIDSGTIAMPCASGSPNCNVGTSGDTVGILSGFAGATGYDGATGLGTLNVANVVNGWSTMVVGTATATVTVTPTPSSINVNQAVSVAVTVGGASGTPTGTVSLSGGGYSASGTLASGTYTFNIPANSLSGGNDTLSVSYSGDTTYATASGTTSVTVTKLTPAVTVVPAQSTLMSNVALTVTGTVSGSGGTPTGTVTLAGGGYTSSAATLAGGNYSITIPANSLSAGSDTLTASYSGDSLYTTATNSAAVTVTTPLTPTVAVTPTSTSINAGQTLNVTGTVFGTGATPTGTLTLSGGGYTSSAQTLVAGAYTFAIPANSLSVGTDSLKVTYSGDTVYGSGNNSANVTVAASVFAVAAAAPAAISKGGSSSSAITLTSTTFYTGTVTLSCALTTSPAGASHLPNCSPAAGGGTITVTAGTPSGTGSVTVTTTAATASMKMPRIGGWAEAEGGALLALLVFFGIPARRRGWRTMLGAFVLLATLGSLAACGGGGGSSGGNNNGAGNPGTTAGSYTFTVTGTGNPAVTPAVTTTFNVTVN